MELFNRQGLWQWFDETGAISPTFKNKVKAQEWFWDTYIGV